MSFLKCIPTVFIVNDEYEILIVTNDLGKCAIKIGSATYYDESAGILNCTDVIHKIRFPQSVLDAAEKYTVIYNKEIKKKAYFSKFGEDEYEDFEFSPVKGEGANAYFLADVHKRFEQALECTAHYNDKTDFYIVNGDIGEVETDEDYYKVIDFLGNLAKGQKPVIFSRGNHDARGRAAERFTHFYISDNGNTYFKFSVGNISGVVLDCGEDKVDENNEYGGVNIFSLYRRRETEFLRSVSLDDGKINFAVSHICHAMTTYKKGDIFDIERDVYSEWEKELERIGVKFMLCGHLHRSFVLDKDNELNTIPHKYPVVFASHIDKDDLWQAFITIKKDMITVTMNDRNGEEKEKYTVEI